jgi:hypothetical protein
MRANTFTSARAVKRYLSQRPATVAFSALTARWPAHPSRSSAAAAISSWVFRSAHDSHCSVGGIPPFQVLPPRASLLLSINGYGAPIATLLPWRAAPLAGSKTVRELSIFSRYLPLEAQITYSSPMRRPLISVMLMLVIALQGSVAAFADIAPLRADCASAAESHLAAAHQTCCSSGSHAMNCCPDTCAPTVAIAASTAQFIWHGRSAPAVHFRTTSFSSRSDSPLIRPPIL